MSDEGTRRYVAGMRPAYGRLAADSKPGAYTTPLGNTVGLLESPHAAAASDSGGRNACGRCEGGCIVSLLGGHLVLLIYRKPLTLASIEVF